MLPLDGSQRAATPTAQGFVRLLEVIFEKAISGLPEFQPR